MKQQEIGLPNNIPKKKRGGVLLAIITAIAALLGIRNAKDLISIISDGLRASDSAPAIVSGGIVLKYRLLLPAADGKIEGVKPDDPLMDDQEFRIELALEKARPVHAFVLAPRGAPSALCDERIYCGAADHFTLPERGFMKLDENVGSGKEVVFVVIGAGEDLQLTGEEPAGAREFADALIHRIGGCAPQLGAPSGQDPMWTEVRPGWKCSATQPLVLQIPIYHQSAR